MSQKLSRRRCIVGAGAAVTIGALAGCADDDDGRNGNGTDNGMDDGVGDDGTDDDVDDGTDDDGMGDDGTDDDGMDDDGVDDDTDGDDTNGEDGMGEDDVPDEIDDYLADAEGYDGTIADHTGEDEVVVDVGAGDVGFAFDPAAIRIDAGTTVRWEWTGEGGAHNVESDEGSDSDFSSGDPVDDPDETFEQSFDDAGIQMYVCTPHEANGMYGAIEVVD